jgi:hypothetical protein
MFFNYSSLGLGFNIVGGTKTPHIPGHNGIFVSKIRPDSPASVDGRLKVGDRVLLVIFKNFEILFVNFRLTEFICQTQLMMKQWRFFATLKIAI